MIRNLLIITFVGLGLAVVGIGGAMTVGGADLARGDWTWVVSEEPGDSGFRIERGSISPDTTRTLEWKGGETLAFDIPGETTYTQGSQPSIVVSGPKAIVDRVRLVDGRLSLAPSPQGERSFIRWSRTSIHGWSENEALRVTVTAPSVRAFDLTGDTDLTIRHYDQPDLKLTLSDSASVSVQGKAQTVAADLSGYSHAELDSLIVQDADIRASRYADIQVGPKGVATIDVSGDAEVDLTRQPDQLRQTVSGEAEVNQD